MRDVTLLSSPQHAHAPTINRALRLIAAPGSQTRMTPAAVTSSAATIMFRPRCSRNSVAASTTVATSSMFNSSDAVAAGVSTRPAVNNTGPIAPPATIATASAATWRRSAPTVGRWAIHHGDTANAAPRYNSPASVNGRMSSARIDAAGVDAPNSTAARAQLRTPDRVTEPDRIGKPLPGLASRRAHRSAEPTPTEGLLSGPPRRAPSGHNAVPGHCRETVAWNSKA